MSTSSSAKRGQFWRADWFVAVLIVMTVVILHQATDLIGTLERRFYDFGSTSSGRQPSERIAVIAIDDQSIANIGRWPWPRDVHAQLIDQLALPRPRPSFTRLSSSSRRPIAGWSSSARSRRHWARWPKARAAGRAPGQADRRGRADSGYRCQAGREHGHAQVTCCCPRSTNWVNRRASPTGRCRLMCKRARWTTRTASRCRPCGGQYPFELHGQCSRRRRPPEPA